MTKNYPEWLSLDYNENVGVVTIKGIPKYNRYYFNFSMQFYLLNEISGEVSATYMIFLKPYSALGTRDLQPDQIILILVILLMVI